MDEKESDAACKLLRREALARFWARIQPATADLPGAVGKGATDVKGTACCRRIPRTMTRLDFS